MGVCTKERKGVTAAVLMATPCTNWRDTNGGSETEVTVTSKLPDDVDYYSLGKGG